MSAAAGSPNRRRWWVAGSLVVAALGLVVVQGLGEATLYFRTADEAVAQRKSLEGRRFRIEGDVVGQSVATTDGGVDFLIASKGVEVPVRHRGDPPEMFNKGIPVVLEGRFDGNYFASDRMLVKHSETYIAENPDRVAPVSARSPGPDVTVDQRVDDAAPLRADPPVR